MRLSNSLIAALLLSLGAREAHAKKMTLPELLDLARAASPGIQAAQAATAAMEAQVSEARRNWLPQGDLLSVLSPSPNVKCLDEAGVPDRNNCVQTSNGEASITNVAWSRVFTRTEVKLIQPVWDFGKISAGVAAARAGVGVAQEKEAGARADVEQNVRKAYWGMKLARDVLDMLDTGSGYVDDGQKKLESDLEKGTGTASVTDKLRMRTVRAEVDARILEAKRGQGLARDGLRTLLGASAPDDIDVDDDDFLPIELKDHPVTYYEDLARYNRPEAKLLDYAVKAKSALADLERRKEYPDLVLIGSGAFARAQEVDDPQNAFLSHYFNSTSFGVAAAVRMQLDLGPKLARADRMAAEAAEIGYRRTEALGGIALEVRKAYGEVTEAGERVKAVQKGEKAAKSWISAVAQNFTVGLAEARDLTDALLAYFNMRYRYLQAVFDYNVAVAALTRATGATDL
ncbi:MAG TPA: TolC family protein [Polyangia bacterium]|nr:TolC family protein [Polyangia bacterium]